VKRIVASGDDQEVLSQWTRGEYRTRRARYVTHPGTARPLSPTPQAGSGSNSRGYIRRSAECICSDQTSPSVTRSHRVRARSDGSGSDTRGLIRAARSLVSSRERSGADAARDPICDFGAPVTETSSIRHPHAGRHRALRRYCTQGLRFLSSPAPASGSPPPRGNSVRCVARSERCTDGIKPCAG